MRRQYAVAWALIALLLCSWPACAERRNLQITITAGTPIRISAQKLLVNRLMIQSKHGNTGLIYVMLGVPVGTTCDATNAAHLSLELGPGDSTHPGQAVSDPQGANGSTPSDGEDLTLACLDGTHSTDVAIVTFWARN